MADQTDHPGDQPKREFTPSPFQRNLYVQMLEVYMDWAKTVPEIAEGTERELRERQV